MISRIAKNKVCSLLLLTLLLNGCSWFDSVGEHFPVIGDRCEYWQCFTTYGQQQSDLIKQQKARAQDAAADAAPSNAKPVNAPGDIPPGASAYTAPAPASEPAAGNGTSSTDTSAGQPAPHHVEFLDPSKMEPIPAPSSDTDSGWLR